MLNQRIVDFINNPYDLLVNLRLGKEYEDIKQYASAISHYMRGAEYGLDSLDYDNKRLLIVECLLRAGECFNKLGSRIHSTKTLGLQALGFAPELPNAYLFLSKMYESEGNWPECNAMCYAALNNMGNYAPFVYNERSYDEMLNEILFQKAVSNYHTGRIDKARIEFYELKKRPNLQKWIVQAIDRSVEAIGKPRKYVYMGYDDGIVSYAQCRQDLIAYELLGNNGTYLEIGSGDPIRDSGTYLLEQRGWEGISVDINEDAVSKFNTTRKNKAVCISAVDADYRTLLEGYPSIIDFLQVDCEPPQVTYNALLKVPFDTYRFRFITYEHDAYRGIQHRDSSRKYLKSLGYEILVSDVKYNEHDAYEDWWIAPELVNKEVLISKGIDVTASTITDIFKNYLK
jgi:tetratricopeptide (TPR) repeat protein